MKSSIRNMPRVSAFLALTMLVSVAAFRSAVLGTPKLFSAHTTTNNSPFSKDNTGVTLTYLEINGWLLSTCGVTILVDPLLEGSLDFGIPDLYQGKKRVLSSYGVTEALPRVDCILLTQGLDDHAHVRTLKKLKGRDPTVPILAPPSAKRPLLDSGFWQNELFNPLQQSSGQVKLMNHGETATISSRTGTDGTVSVRVTQGALVGPPWQRRENGYILKGSAPSSSKQHGPSIYIEPHVEFKQRELERLKPVDVVISPISGQSLPAFELVHGPKDVIRLVETLQPKFLVPMQNGDIDTDGPVANFVSPVGSAEEFQRRLGISRTGRNTRLVDVVPGQDIKLSL